MTLRTTLEIIPFGNEDNKYPIFRISIHNIETIRDEGFGHVYCKYKVEIEKYNNETIQKFGNPEWELEEELIISEHDRRDGALSLVKKALDLAIKE